MGYDVKDEINSQQATVDAANALEIPLNTMQKDFVARTSDNNFIKQYYPELAQYDENTAADNGKTDDELKSYFNKAKLNITEFAFRRDGKNVILKKKLK